MFGYDSPEMKPLLKTPDRESIIVRAREAKGALEFLLAKNGFNAYADMYGFDKYGRILVRLHLPDGTHVNQWMIDHGHGVPYDGGTKQ